MTWGVWRSASGFGPQIGGVVNVPADAAPSGGFADIFGANLVAWYDASDAASITHVGGAVSQWNDISGNGAHLTQATGANQPTYSATGLGGAQPAITFDGVDNWMETAATAVAPGAVSVFAAFFVGRWSDAGSDAYARLVTYRANGQANDYDNAASAVLITRDASSTQINSYRNEPLAAEVIPYDTTVRLAVVWSSGDVNKIYLDNVAAPLDNHLGGNLGATGALAVGGMFGTVFAEMVACEIAFVKIEPSGTQLSDVETMLAAKWTA
jgi:hypothetical protein